MYPQEYRYSKDHEWLKQDGELYVLGITDYAQNELGEVVYVDLPEPGDAFEAGESLGAIDSSKTSADVFTPIACEVAEVNTALDDAPERVNDDPHGKGWLVKLRATSTAELDELMSAEQYEAFIAEQS